MAVPPPGPAAGRRKWADDRYYFAGNHQRIEVDISTMTPAPMGEAAPPTLCVQVVAYCNDPAQLLRSAESLARSIEAAQRSGQLSQCFVRYGDCSPEQVLAEDQLGRLRQIFDSMWGQLDFTFFGANLGSAGGHNRLFEALDTALVVVANPDLVWAPDTIGALLRGLAPGVGIVEARQIPLEHPKTYAELGDTSWASMACSLVRSEVIQATGGFDADSFFLYCDDVDLSWRARLAGYRVVFEPAARIFHDKRIGADGAIEVSDAEIYFSAEAAPILAHKYSRPDLVASILAGLEASTWPEHRRAVDEFRRREARGELPAPIDGDHRVAQFVDGTYATHRF